MKKPCRIAVIPPYTRFVSAVPVWVSVRSKSGKVKVVYTITVGARDIEGVMLGCFVVGVAEGALDGELVGIFDGAVDE